MKRLGNIAVIGGGSWATALVKILSEHKALPNTQIQKLQWWVRTEEKAEYIRTKLHNPDYISAIEIHPELVEVSANIEAVVSSADALLIAIPAAFLEKSIEALPKELFKDKVIISAIKGLVPSTKQIVGDYFVDVYGTSPKDVLVISGPCHAEEVANEKLSYLTIAGLNQDLARHFAQLLSCAYIRSLVSADVRGTEYGAVLKNIYAVAAGICHGLGYGDNFQAVLMSNSIREMKRFLRNLTDTDRKINHSAYLGDLLVTGYSVHSRNRTFGNMIGKGYTVQAAQLEMKMIAEGYYATATIHDLNEKLQIKMPIMDTIHQILYEGKPAKKAIEKLTEKLV
ncbi:MAG: NAD(P)H-dependent glycerol-3-phosphate dehydrogenase [Bacteroidetes bacterium]|jgi:glycerol-3-phosphate dehydrogenase (NAD(P)+)|nr:NAD(P)H-dependent glycerol-3-phosphate dehydrogenase [Bacteroidota bacterium]